MRHGDKVNNLGRKKAHRIALLQNLTANLIEHKRIFTTLAKAKALRIYAEPLITKAKIDNTPNRRHAFAILQQKESIKELFDVVMPKIGDRPGGYTRIIKMPRRQGDAADMAMIEFVDFNEIYSNKSETKAASAKKKRTRRGKAAAAPTAPQAETTDAPDVDTTESASESAE